MKKTLAVLMLAAMLLSVGCGNQAQETAKDAQQKVEQKAEEIKDDAEKKADELKQDAAEIKDATVDKVDELKSDAEDIAKETVDKLDSVADEISGRTVALSGVMPGTSLDDLKAMFGEPTATDGDIMTFVDGLKVTLDSAKKVVKEISTTSDSFDTPEGIYVGADEYLLNDYCGQADATRKIENGAEYEYNSGDKKSKVIYKAQNGIITEITCSLK
jgi:hypothetical protein